MLNAADIAFYREHGYLVVPDVLSSDEVARLRAACDDLVEKSRAVAAHTEVYDLEDSHTAETPHVRRIKTPDRWDDAFASIVDHTKIVAIMDDLIGPGVRFDISKLNMKDADGGAPVEWHQDWAFYPHTNDDLCAVGIMIDDMTLENGPLMVVPGSHKGPVYDHHAHGRFCGAINDPAAEAEYEKAVPVTGTAGSISIHHVRMVHGSVANRSGDPRRLLLHQYRAADAWPMVIMPSDWQTYEGQLVSGESTLEPRMEKVPVRLPFPPAENQGSIYENQRATVATQLIDATGRQRVG